MWTAVARVQCGLHNPNMACAVASRFMAGSFRLNSLVLYSVVSYTLQLQPDTLHLDDIERLGIAHVGILGLLVLDQLFNQGLGIIGKYLIIPIGKLIESDHAWALPGETAGTIPGSFFCHSLGKLDRLTAFNRYRRRCISLVSKN